ELDAIRGGHETLSDLVDEMFRADSIVTDEIRSVEKELTAWVSRRARLQDELRRHGEVMVRAREYEEAIRAETLAIRELLGRVEEEFRELALYRDEVRLASVNLQLAPETERAEFQTRARSYASRVGGVCERMKELIGAVDRFVSRHPGGALLSVLESHAVPEDEIGGVEKEHARLEQVLAKWRTSGASALESGEKARELIREMEKSDVLAHQLEETVEVINDQARQNLGRWN
ncbi:MAG: hypothetical protein HUU37_11275, partial [Bdellovibrionales bacterium]|nr:hypothetical protein [Bdellovibrionales bacterium]